MEAVSELDVALLLRSLHKPTGLVQPLVVVTVWRLSQRHPLLLQPQLALEREVVQVQEQEQRPMLRRLLPPGQHHRQSHQ